MMRRQIITPDDAHKFFGDCRAAIIASADRERAWFDCAKEIGRKVCAKEIGPAYAADQLREVIREQSLFTDDSEDEIQATIAAMFERAAEEPRLAVNGHGAIAEEPPPVTSPEEYDARPMERVEATRPRFRLEMLDEITIADDPVELIQGLLPMGPALGVVFGPPKSLKSFLLVHVGLHIADSRPFCGRAVQGGVVVYVTSEGLRGVRRRLIAVRRAMGIEGRKVPFALVSTMPNLGAGEADRTELQKTISHALPGIGMPLRLIVIDTFRRAMPGKSENEQKDVSIVVDNCEALARAFGCLVVLVHHSPRSDDQRGSGSNAVDAAADLMWSVIRPDESRRSATATVVRYKDGEEGDAWTFELHPLEIGTDHNGNPIASCSVEVTIEPERRSTPAKFKPLSEAQQRVFDILLTASIEVGIAGLAGDAAPRCARAVTRETLKDYAKAAGWWDDADDKADKSSRTRFAARLNELAGKRAIGLTAAHVWPAGRAP
jgi:AAA domain